MAGAELPEILPGPPLLEIRAQQALDGGGHLRGRNAHALGPREAPVLPHRPADRELVRIHHVAIHPRLLAIEPDVGDPVLAAAVRAAGDVDPQMLLEAGQALLQTLHEPAREAL